MGQQEKKAAIVVGPSEGNTVSVMGGTYRILINGRDSGGAFAVIDMLVPPGAGPGPHAHAAFEELFYIIEGQIELRTEFGNCVGTAGSFVRIPRGGIVHCFKNIGDRPAHLLCTVVPAGLDAFFEEIGRPVAPGEYLPLPEMDKSTLLKIQDTAAKYGTQVFPPDYLDKQ